MFRPCFLFTACTLTACGTTHDGRVDASPAAPAADARAAATDAAVQGDGALGDAIVATDARTAAADAAAQNVDRGPTRIDVDGDPNGLFWDAADQALYVADDNGNRILKWTDAAGFGLERDLPATTAQSPGLGQLVHLSDGTFVVTRFGFGSDGDVVTVAPDGTGHIVPGLDPARRRIGLTVAPDGQLYDGWFVRIATGDRVGAVGRLDLAGQEPELLTGLQKPVGVLAVDDALYVSDQDLSQILRAPLADPTHFTVFASVPTPDLLTIGPGGSLFTGSAGGNLYHVAADGTASLYQSGFQSVRGVAYDAAHKRLFVVDHDDDESDGARHILHILPIDTEE